MSERDHLGQPAAARAIGTLVSTVGFIVLAAALYLLLATWRTADVGGTSRPGTPLALALGGLVLTGLSAILIGGFLAILGEAFTRAAARLFGRYTGANEFVTDEAALVGRTRLLLRFAGAPLFAAGAWYLAAWYRIPVMEPAGSAAPTGAAAAAAAAASARLGGASSWVPVFHSALGQYLLPALALLTVELLLATATLLKPAGRRGHLLLALLRLGDAALAGAVIAGRNLAQGDPLEWAERAPELAHHPGWLERAPLGTAGWWPALQLLLALLAGWAILSAFQSIREGFRRR